MGLTQKNHLSPNETGGFLVFTIPWDTCGDSEHGFNEPVLEMPGAVP